MAVDVINYLPLVDHIFSFLDLSDLQNCLKVNKFWKQTAAKRIAKIKEESLWSFVNNLLKLPEKGFFSKNYSSANFIAALKKEYPIQSKEEKIWEIFFSEMRKSSLGLEVRGLCGSRITMLSSLEVPEILSFSFSQYLKNFFSEQLAKEPLIEIKNSFRNKKMSKIFFQNFLTALKEYKGKNSLHVQFSRFHFDEEQLRQAAKALQEARNLRSFKLISCNLNEEEKQLLLKSSPGNINLSLL
ncbi:MAG: hypothetical protein Tsb0015_13970 [Simkaniaceae bacterium]